MRFSRTLTVARLIGAGLLGYGLIVVLTTVGFVGWLENANLARGDAALKAKGILVAVVSGALGGALAGVCGGRRSIRYALAVLPWIALDTAYVLFFLPRTDPIWFDLAGSLTLGAATVLGGVGIALVRGRDRAAPVAP